MSTSSTPPQQTVQEVERPASYQCLFERAQSKLAHFQELLSLQEQRQLDTELAYKQRIDDLRKDLRATKQELLEDCVQESATRAAAQAASIYDLKQQRRRLQDENSRLRASLRSAETELTAMSQELQNNELLKAELLERHLADTILERQVDKLMDVEQGAQVLDADFEESDDAGSIQPSQTLLEELQIACSGPLAPVPPNMGMPEPATILWCDGYAPCSESRLQVAVLSSTNDCPSLGGNQATDGDVSIGFSFTPPAKFLNPTTGNADQLVRVLGHYLHQHYQHVLGGRQEQQHNPFSWFVKTSAIVTISWAAMTMQMLSMVETLVGDVDSRVQIPT
ncbi:hypothetical protein BGZ68_006418 [Mortierella alpina]|nr:hypothetical protein BGZ68_006418 [Mortierella alpina]